MSAIDPGCLEITGLSFDSPFLFHFIGFADLSCMEAHIPLQMMYKLQLSYIQLQASQWAECLALWEEMHLKKNHNESLNYF